MKAVAGWLNAVMKAVAGWLNTAIREFSEVTI